MKKVLLVAAALLLIAGAVNAKGYVGLFADQGHSDCDVMLVGGFMPFELWIWMLPEGHGLQAAEYKITYPAGVISSTVTTNPDITVSLGDITSGISVAFGPCEMGWVWSQHQACYLTSSAPGFVTISGRPDALPYGLQYASCELGYPIYGFTVLNNLALNRGCQIATENASWGAIKSLF